MAEPAGNKYNVQGVSFRSREFLDKGKARAARLRMSFSQYINYLIEKDLDQRAPMVLSEDAKPHGNTDVAKRMQAEKEPLDPRVKSTAAALFGDAVRAVESEKKKK